MTAEQQAREKLRNKMGSNPIDTSSLSEEPDHSDPAKFQEGRKEGRHVTVNHIQFLIKKGSTVKTRIAFGGGAKPSNGTKQHK